MDLEGFLATQEEMGEWDSRAGFTIAVEKAREAMARYAIASPGFYLLKLIQASVALGSSQISVRLFRKEVVLSFHAPVTVSMEMLLELIADPERLTGQPPTGNADVAGCAGMTACGCFGPMCLAMGPLGWLGMILGLGSWAAYSAQNRKVERPSFAAEVGTRLDKLVESGWPGLATVPAPGKG